MTGRQFKKAVGLTGLLPACWIDTRVLFLCLVCICVVKYCISFCLKMTLKYSRKFTVSTCVLFDSYFGSQDVLFIRNLFFTLLSFLSRFFRFKVIPIGFRSTFTLHFNLPSHLVTNDCYDNSRRLKRFAVDALVKHILFLDCKISLVVYNFLTACSVVLQ